MTRYVHVLLLATVALALLAGQAVAGITAQGGLRVNAPGRTLEGEPFTVQISVQGPCEAVRLSWLGRQADIPLAADGRTAQAEALLGAGLGTTPGDYTLVVETLGPGRAETALCPVTVSAKQFPEQHLTLPKSMVTPSPEIQARVKREQAQIAQAMSQVSRARLWTLPLVRPVPGEVSSAFGLKRVLNGQPRAGHRGLDLRGSAGDPVACVSPGKVLLVGDFYYNGKSVFVDHGQGVISMYFHLSRVDVGQGQSVAEGQVVGLVGSTGRSTGPHLHFGLNILGQALDPTPLFGQGQGAAARKAAGQQPGRRL